MTSGYVPHVRTLIIVIAGAALGLIAVLVVSSLLSNDPVTKAEIEREVAKRPQGNVQVVLCNEQIVPTQAPRPSSERTWTCDTYIGPTKADAQNGPSYLVTVDDDKIASIRRVPVH
jgi:hypothetical protein